MDMEEIPEFLRRKVGEKIIYPETKTAVVVKETAPEIEIVEDGPTQREKIQRGMRENASELIAEINEAYDEFLEYGHLAKKFNAYDFLRVKEVKPAITQLIIDKFQPQLDEIENIKNDAELKEAYRHLDAQARRDIIGFLSALIADSRRWIDNQKAGKGGKGSRGPSAIKPEKKIKWLKFQKEDRDLKLLSIPPEKIIGAQELWTYNTKYKHLTHYVARTRAGLSVKRTTIQDFDVDNSITKVLRKPEETLTKVLEKKKKILHGLTTKPIVPTGRINENTILLRVG